MYVGCERTPPPGGGDDGYLAGRYDGKRKKDLSQNFRVQLEKPPGGISERSLQNNGADGEKWMGGSKKNDQRRMSVVKPKA